MTRPVAIATPDTNLFEAIRKYLVRSEYPGITEDTIALEPLAHAEAARDWLDTPGRTLLVIDAELPSGSGSSNDRFSRGQAVQQLQLALEGTIAETTPRLVITPTLGAYREVEASCTPNRHAIALPMRQLNKHREAIVRPFLAMLLGKQDASGVIPETFRVIEVDFRSPTSHCLLGFGYGALLLWEDSQQVYRLRKSAKIFESESFYKNLSWPQIARQYGEDLFSRHVVDALGEGLFGHIERAAGGLGGLAFRYLITDHSLYLAPFEASVRPMVEQEGPFVLLRAPLARQLPVIGATRAMKDSGVRMPTPARVLFVRSQMGEHPDGPTTGDNYTLLLSTPEGEWKRKLAQFPRLDNLDVELEELRKIAETRPDRLILEEADLSNMEQRNSSETAADYLKRRLEEQYDVVHYAGHAWSELDGSAHLILPGATRGEASGIPMSAFAACQGLSDTRLIYLSACRGISKGTVQHLVDYGIPHAVGFRYKVEDDKAAKFASAFYTELFNHGFVPAAFRAACFAARDELKTEDESPIWLSPILLAQTPNWAMRA